MMKSGDIKTTLISVTAALSAMLFPVSGNTQTSALIPLDVDQTEKCITMMAGFPNDEPGSRYVFFRLSQELSKGITPELSQLMADHLAKNKVKRLPPDWPIMDVIEGIADPVLRQAAPAQTVAFMAHIAYFNALCGSYVDGQVEALRAYDPDLEESDILVREDALYLRQILAEALNRLNETEDDLIEAYSADLVAERDDIEFTQFDSDIDELETLFMGDLDEKLATSNDMINNEAEIGLDDAISLSRSMNIQASRRAKEERVYTLVRILGGTY